jgi:anti-sigma factor RsiW
MLCEMIENKILDYQDNQLSADQRAEVETHLAGCPACRELARQLQQLDAALSTRVKIPALSAGFDRQLREQIQSTPADLSDAQRAERRRQLQAEFEAGMARIGRGSFTLGRLLNYLAWPAVACVAGWLAWRLTAEWAARLPAQSLGGFAPIMIPCLAASAVFLAVGLAQAFPRTWRFFRV